MNRPTLAVLALLMFAGCSPSAPAAAPTVTVTATTTATVTFTPTPTPAATGQTLSLGKSYEAQSVKLTVTEVKAQPQGNHDRPLMGAMAQACNSTGQAVEFSASRWTATTSDGSLFEVAGTIYGNDPAPRYPFQQVVDSGQCIKGWLLFEVPAGNVIDAIRYASTGGAAVMLATWKA